MPSLPLLSDIGFRRFFVHRCEAPGLGLRHFSYNHCRADRFARIADGLPGAAPPPLRDDCEETTDSSDIAPPADAQAGLRPFLIRSAAPPGGFQSFTSRPPPSR